MVYVLWNKEAAETLKKQLGPWRSSWNPKEAAGTLKKQLEP